MGAAGAGSVGSKGGKPGYKWKRFYVRILGKLAEEISEETLLNCRPQQIAVILPSLNIHFVFHLVFIMYF